MYYKNSSKTEGAKQVYISPRFVCLLTPSPTERTCTRRGLMPCLPNASFLATSRLTSMIRPLINGPRSLMRTMQLRPVLGHEIRASQGRGRVL